MDVVINYKNWVWVASTSFPGLFPSRGGRPTREGKSPGNEVGVACGLACGLCVNKMADDTSSSEDEEIENPIIARKQQLARFVNQIVTLTV